jgi:metal-sulfur cluster biosynthetic enzyme
MTDNTAAAAATSTAEDRLPTEEEVRRALKSVYDPELGISIVDLGLVYGVQVDEDTRNVVIDMTLTTPACPLGPIIKTQAHSVLVNAYSAINDVDINLVWSPRWDPHTMASEEAKAELGIW